MDLLGIAAGIVLPIFGFGVAFFINDHFQRKQFAHAEAQYKDKIRGLINILIQDLKDYYNALFIDASALCLSMPDQLFLNYKDFDFSNKNAMWPIIMADRCFIDNKQLFNTINKITQLLAVLNKHVEIMRPHKDYMKETSADIINFKTTIKTIHSHYDKYKIEKRKPFENTELRKHLDRLLESI